MALTISDIGSGTSTTNNTTLASGTTVTANVGDFLLICIAASNDGTSGAARTVTLADNAGGSTNVYTQRGTTGNRTAGGVAGDGASQFFIECPVTTALSNATVTVTFSGNTAQKAMQIYRLQPGTDEQVKYVSVGTASTGGSTTHSAATVSVTNGDTIFGMAAIETDDTITGDSDTTNGNWSAIITRLADAGVDTAAMSCSSQYKTVNATGNQSWACTTASTRQSARNYIIYDVVPAPRVAVTGVSGTGSSGDVIAKGGVGVGATGVTATGSAGAVSVATTSFAYVEVSAPALLGVITGAGAQGEDTSAVTGWGRYGWGDGGWGEDIAGNISVNVNVTGVSASGSSGEVTVSADANNSTTGSSASGSAGDVDVSGDANIALSGVSATASPGDVTTIAIVNVDVSGVSASGSSGDVTVAGAANADATGSAASGAVGNVSVSGTAVTAVTGVEATGSVGAVEVFFPVTIYASGVEASGQVGQVEVSGVGNVDVPGVAGSAAVGNAIIAINATAPVSGVEATGSVGSVVVTSRAVISLTGVQATGAVNDNLLIWGLIDTSQTPAWAGVTDSQTPNWQDISASQTPGWSNISTPQTPGWAEIADTETTWTQIAA